MVETIALILFFLILSGLFSGTEIAFVSANKLLIELKRKRAKRRGEIIAKFFEKPAHFLGAMLVGNNLAMVALTAMTGALLTPYVSQYISSEFGVLFINSILITIVVLIFGEFLPKALFEVFAERALFLFAYPINLFRWLLSPLAWLMIRLSDKFLSALTGKVIESQETAFTRMDLEEYIIQPSLEAGESDDEQPIDKSLFQNALNFNDLRVRDAMVPRNEIVAFDSQDSLDDLRLLFSTSKHSRILVFEDEVDDLIGYYHHQQVLALKTKQKPKVLEIEFVPEAMSLTDLLQRFIGSRDSIAAVVDEYGALTGLITMEDIIEEIFGDISDEHDDEDFVEEQLDEDTYLFSARLEVDYLNDKYPNLEIPTGEYTTLSGYIVMTEGSIPAQGDKIELGKHAFILEQVSDTRIELVRIESNRDYDSDL